MVKRAQNRSEKIQKIGAAIAKNLSGSKTLKQRSVASHLIRSGSDSRRGSSTAHADAFTGSEREEKTSACFGRNDRVV